MFEQFEVQFELQFERFELFEFFSGWKDLKKF
jgi:hypothetical protein